MRVDVRDRAAVRMAPAGADVVVHGVFALYGLGLGLGETALFDTNVRGSLHGGWPGARRSLR